MLEGTRQYSEQNTSGERRFSTSVARENRRRETIRNEVLRRFAKESRVETRQVT